MSASYPSRLTLNVVHARVGHSSKRSIYGFIGRDVAVNHHPNTDLYRAKTMPVLQPCALKGWDTKIHCYVTRLYSQQTDEQEIPEANTLTQLDFSILDMDATRTNAYTWKPEDLELLTNQLEEVETLNQSDILLLINPLVEACSRLQQKDKAADLSERILFNCLARIPSDIATRFQDNHTETGTDVSSSWPYPSQELYTKVMTIVGGLRSEDAANRVNRLFRLMTAEYRAELLYTQQAIKIPNHASVKSAAPSMSTFKTLLRAWSVSRTAMGAKEAENVLVEMEELSGRRGDISGHTPNTNKSKVRNFSIAPPDIECYNMVLTAYSRVSSKHHPLVANRFCALFRRMRQLEDAGNFSLDWFSYRAYLKCVQGIMDHSNESLDDTIVADLERIVPQLATVAIPNSFFSLHHSEGVHPRAWAFSIVIKGLLHKTVAESRVRTADRLVRERIGVDAFLDDILEDDVSRAQMWQSAETLVALTVAWRQSQLVGSEDALKRVQSWAIQSSYLTLHHRHIAMQVWSDSRSPEAPQIVQALLDGTLHPSSPHRPTRQTFTIAMHTWIRSNQANLANKVEHILFTMRDKYREEHDARYIADDTHLNLVLKAWQALCTDGQQYTGENGFLYPAQHACAHLDHMQASNGWNPRNYGHYSTCLKAWASQVVKEDDHDTFPAREAAFLLSVMQHRSGACPPAPHCNMVLLACARDDIPPTRRFEAYEIALDTFNKGNRDTFSYILAVVIVKLSVFELKQDHLDFIESVVRTCRDSGQLTQALIYEAIEVLGKTQLESLFHFPPSYVDMILENRSTRLVRKDGKKLRWTGQIPHGLNTMNLPKSWSRNTESSKFLRQ